MYGDLLTKIVVRDDEYRCLVAERAYPLAKSDSGLMKYLLSQAVDPDDFKKVITYLHPFLTSQKVAPMATREYDDILRTSDEDGLLSQLSQMCVNFNILPGDFDRFSSWGVVRLPTGKEKVCLRDYGLTVGNWEEFVAGIRPDQSLRM